MPCWEFGQAATSLARTAPSSNERDSPRWGVTHSAAAAAGAALQLTRARDRLAPRGGGDNGRPAGCGNYTHRRRARATQPPPGRAEHMPRDARARGTMERW